MPTNTAFRIIIIDDNPAIYHDFVKILATMPASFALDAISEKMFGKKNNGSLLPIFEIDSASQGQEGVDKIKQALQTGSPYSLAFVDIRMPPGWDGIETIKHIWELDNDVQIVICTAYSDYSWEETVEKLGKKDNLLILKKPFDNVSVRQLACALTQKWQLLQDSRKFTISLQEQIADRTVSLEQSLSIVKATLESSDEGIIVFNDKEKILDYNQKFLSMWKIPQKTIESKNEAELVDYMQQQLINPSHFKTWLHELHQAQDLRNIDIINLKDGRIFDCYSHPQILNEHIVGRVLNFRDITKRVILESALQYQATHDSLTGLPNRVILFDKIREAIQAADQHQTIFSVIFLDLDRFKLINDSLNHAAGDELLKAASNRLGSVIREKDLLARLGGDEFVILLADIKNEADVITKAQQIISLFQKPFKISDRMISITASVGITIYPRDGQTIDNLLRNADAAMYHAKELGSNNFQFYSKELNDKSLEKFDQEMQLHRAIANNQLSLCYQPQFDITNGKLIAVEALVRWNHPKKGVLLPIDFIPLAEETGLIIPIGEWVMQTACKQNASWQKAGFPPMRIGVNITAQQIKQENFIDMISGILEQTSLKPEYLELELTENVIISSIAVINKLTILKDLGVQIAIDDFGTGYSSLSYLKKLPLDRLKIDSSFIQNIQSATDDEVIIRAIIAVAKNLNLEVLAEGVETQNQLDFLKSQNCDEIQGYLFSKPLTATELVKLMKHTAKKKIPAETE